VTTRRLALLVVVAALTGAAVPAGGNAANECSGIPRCISVAGPWVAVPATGEVMFLLDCPQQQGVVGGTDAVATSSDIRASFDGILGSPVAFGRTTTRYAMFRAVSASHKGGAFRPYLGCIPTASPPPSTTAAKIKPVGPPLDLKSTSIPVIAGTVKRASFGCGTNERLVDSWNVTTFATTDPPPAAYNAMIRVKRVVHGDQASITVMTASTLPGGAQAQVQLGVRCALR
jgi:hypothetical protein